MQWRKYLHHLFIGGIHIYRMSFHFLGDKDRARSYYNVKEAYGENTLEMFAKAHKMWNAEPLLHRYSYLADEYGWK